MKKILPLAVFLFVILAPQTFGQTDTMLNLRSYSQLFHNANGNIAPRYNRAATDEDYDRIKALGGSPTDIDTPLEIALLSNAAGVIDIRPAEASQMLGTPRQADLKLGAAVFQEMQVFRFLGDTAAAGRHEAMLQFITGRGNATRAEVEAFYRNGVRALVSDMVDEQIASFRSRGQQIYLNASAMSDIKGAITEFMLAPSVTTYRNLLSAYRRNAGDGAMVLGFTMSQINGEVSLALSENR